MRTIALSQGLVALVDDTDYDWLVQRGKWHAVRGNDKHFYAARNVACCGPRRQRIEKMHRVILGLTDPRIKTDHQDGNSLNNRRYNIRIATSTQNNRNAALRSDNSSGIRGVSIDHLKWRAEIDVDGKTIYLGSFKSLAKAAQVRRAAEIEHHKEFSAILSRGD